MQGSTLTETILGPLREMKAVARSSSIAVAVVVFILVAGTFVSTRFLDSSASLIVGNSALKSSFVKANIRNYPPESPKITKKPQENKEIPLNCSLGTQTRTCPANYYPSKFPLQNQESSSIPPPFCPEYFRWIHTDLWPWRETGISAETVMKAQKTANFRLIIVNGTAYVEKYRKSFQTRDKITLWGILQLLRRYPGKVPDLDLMFNAFDRPTINKAEWVRGPNASAPPPLFRYCGDDTTLDIPFPDWSFWGWPEINIKPWVDLAKDLKEGNGRMKWEDREPHAYWKGNPSVAVTRRDLLKCNVSDKQDWGARIYAQNWVHEQKQGYKQSDLASQCIHRFKIYIEGSAWSVSEKYILACDSLTLLVKPRYYDFFTRSLMPLQHYWPIRPGDKCRSIKYAVDRGNNHTEEAQYIGRVASNFIQEELKIDNVYDYMFHLLNEYSKLLNYQPTVPPKAVELCSESMACPESGLEKKFMEETLVRGPADAAPCSMPAPYDPATLHSILEKKENTFKQVEMWEKEYWENQNKQT